MQLAEIGCSADLPGADAGLAEIHMLYRCHDLLLAHKEALFEHLMPITRSADGVCLSFIGWASGGGLKISRAAAAGRERETRKFLLASP